MLEILNLKDYFITMTFKLYILLTYLQNFYYGKENFISR